MLDCTFSGGAKYNDVYWTQTRSLSNYSIKWTLNLNTEPESVVTITDKDGNQAITAGTGADGTISEPLTQSIIRPVEWNPNGNEVSVTKKSQYQGEQFNPYTIKVEKNDEQKVQTVIMDSPKNISIHF